MIGSGGQGVHGLGGKGVSGIGGAWDQRVGVGCG